MIKRAVFALFLIGVLDFTLLAGPLEEFVVTDFTGNSWEGLVSQLRQAVPLALKESSQKVDLKSIGEISVLLWQVGFHGYPALYEEAVVIVKPRTEGGKVLLVYTQRFSFSYEDENKSWQLSSNALSEKDGLLFDAEYLDENSFKSESFIGEWIAKRVNLGVHGNSEIAVLKRAIFSNEWNRALGRHPNAREKALLGIQGGKKGM